MGCVQRVHSGGNFDAHTIRVSDWLAHLFDRADLFVVNAFCRAHDSQFHGLEQYMADGVRNIQLLCSPACRQTLLLANSSQCLF